jgi:hypothetical protein
VKMLKETRAAVQSALDRGETLEQMMQEKLLSPWKQYDGILAEDVFLKILYTSLSACENVTHPSGRPQNSLNDRTVGVRQSTDCRCVVPESGQKNCKPAVVPPRARGMQPVMGIKNVGITLLVQLRYAFYWIIELSTLRIASRT